MTYIDRKLFNEIKEWVQRREIIAIKGPRQSGKTTLLKMLSAWLEDSKHIDKEHIIYTTFEDRGKLDEFSENPKDFIGRKIIDKERYYFLIDEAQYCKDLGQKLKLVYDLFENVKLIITGSSSLELKNQTGKFLVGRILEFELFPLSFYEFLNYKDKGLAKLYALWNESLFSFISGKRKIPVIKKEKDPLIGDLLKYLDEYLTYGGYPAVVLAERQEDKVLLLKNLINTYIDRDIFSFLKITDTLKFRRLITAIAALNGGMLNINKLSNEVGSYFKEITNLMDVLEQTYTIRRINPYSKNLVTELKKEQKVYFIDTGLRNALIDNFTSINIRQDAGLLAENFVLNELSLSSKLRFWRTTAKTEVDFVVDGSQPLPIEVKFQRFLNTSGTKSVYGFLNAYASETAMIITKDFWGEKTYQNSRILFIPVVYL